MKKTLPIATKWLLAQVVLMFSASLVYADGAALVLCTEDATTGCVAPLGGPVPPVPTLTVGSDGEAFFDPFGYGANTSDGIQLNSNWVPNNWNGAFNAGFWTNTDVTGAPLGGGFTWVLPASTPCGVENEPSCEPIAYWTFAPGSGWLPGTTPQFNILEAGGTISDLILLNNNTPNGAAQIIFRSDPNLVPEPGTLTFFGSGLLGLVLLRLQILRPAHRRPLGPPTTASVSGLPQTQPGA